MKANEVNKTILLVFDISEASARTRTGMPNEEGEDKNLPIWSGIIPIASNRLAPIADESSINIALPEHLKNTTPRS